MVTTKNRRHKRFFGPAPSDPISTEDPYLTYRSTPAPTTGRVLFADWTYLYVEHSIQAHKDVTNAIKGLIGRTTQKATSQDVALTNLWISYYHDAQDVSPRTTYLWDQFERYQQLHRVLSSHAFNVVRFKNSWDSHFAGARLPGPIQFLGKLLDTWQLGQSDAIPLLGLEEADSSYVSDLFDGRVTVRGRDLKHRIAYLFRIRKTLSALFQSVEVENEWLREPHDALNGHTPMDRLLEGSMENLLLVKEYVETAAGR